MESALIEIELGRKREKWYGEWLVKVPRTAAHILEAYGWVLVHDTHSAMRTYVGMRPPIGHTRTDEVVRVSVEVPSQAELDALASERHAAGHYWQGRIGLWDASYHPAGAFVSGGERSHASFRAGYNWGWHYNKTWTGEGEELAGDLNTTGVISRVQGWCETEQSALF
jgi:hypothetical protein